MKHTIQKIADSAVEVIDLHAPPLTRLRSSRYAGYEHVVPLDTLADQIAAAGAEVEVTGRALFQELNDVIPICELLDAQETGYDHFACLGLSSQTEHLDWDLPFDPTIRF